MTSNHATTDVYNLNNVSFQALHGIMLVNFNRMASELRLSHSEYRLMTVLIGHWNKEQKRAFPSVKTLSKLCCMSNSTVSKNLNKLNKLGLVFVTKNKSRNNYYLNEKLLLSEKTSVTPCGNESVTPWSNLTKERTKEKITPNHFFKQKKSEPYKTTWKDRNVQNRPANIKLKQLSKSKFVIHKPSGKKIKALPDVGSHLLFKYHQESNLVEFFESNVTDYLDHFGVVSFLH